ncbi:RidA family protein [Burkholderia ubonensis]|uniref:RidA family protein n=1 Tax=Burkholderia ubonensis TaxID=101571 RepID=UPI0009B4746B|nr:RidA family protein [Burkholderia ubonensis]
MTTFLNPPEVHKPVGAYSHTAAVPESASLLFLSGQVGMRPDGSVPSAFSEQVEVTFQNLRACLAAYGLNLNSVVKLSTFLLPGQDVQIMREVRQRYLGNHQPASTTVYVPQLVDPVFLIEIEAIAAIR